MLLLQGGGPAWVVEIDDPTIRRLFEPDAPVLAPQTHIAQEQASAEADAMQQARDLEILAGAQSVVCRTATGPPFASGSGKAGLALNGDAASEVWLLQIRKHAGSPVPLLHQYGARRQIVAWQPSLELRSKIVEAVGPQQQRRVRLPKRFKGSFPVGVDRQVDGAHAPLCVGLRQPIANPPSKVVRVEFDKLSELHLRVRQYRG